MSTPLPLAVALVTALGASGAACQAGEEPRALFGRIVAAYPGAAAERRVELEQQLRQLCERLEHPGASVAASMLLAEVCMWFALDRQPRPAADDADAWFGRASAAAQRAGQPDYALQFEIERVKIWVARQRLQRAAEVLDASRSLAEKATWTGGLLYRIYRGKLAVQTDLARARQLAAASADYLGGLEQRGLADRSLHEARCWVAGLQVETALAAGLLQEGYAASERERAAARACGDPAALLRADMHAVKLDVAAARSRSAARRCDEYLRRGDLAPGDRAFFLLHRAVSSVQRANGDQELLGGALADLEEVFALGVLGAGAAASWRIRQADFLSRAGETDAARDVLDGVAAERVRRLPAKEAAYYHGLRSHLRTGAADPRQRDALERSFADLLEAWQRVAHTGAQSYLEYGQDRLLIGELVRARLGPEPGPAEVGQALQALLEVQAMSGLARRNAVAAPSLAQLQRALVAPGGGVLCYSFARERCHVFAIDATSAQCFEIDSGDVAIRAAVDRAVLCGRVAPLRRQLAGARRAVARLLLPPGVAACLARWTSVSVVGLDEVGQVPFAWLPLPDGRRVLEQCAVGHLGSVPAGLLAAARPAAGAARLDAVVVTAPEPAAAVAARFGELPAFPVAEHAEAWRRRLDSAKVRVAHGVGASYGVLRQPDLRTAAALVVVCHGVVEPDGVALIWSPEPEHDGVIRAAELRALGAADGPALPRLVCLLSCNASSAPVRRGEFGSHDLAGAALEAGAQAVLVSPEVLGYRFALDFAERYWRALQRPGATPASALQELQRAAGVDPADALGNLRVVGLGHQPWAGGR